MTSMPSSMSGSRAAWVVLIESAALVVATAAWAIPAAMGSAVPPWAAGVSVVLLALELATLVWISGIRAVAIQTFHQCFRTKVGLAFIVLLAVSLAVLPLIMKGDGTLAGQLRTLLSYGTGIIAMLLSLVTIFLGASIVSNDVRAKHIFITITKPLPRWQYLLGRWLGLIALNALLLCVSAAALYGVAQYLRSRDSELNDEDRRAVETEVFAARGRVQADPVDVDSLVRSRLAQLRQEGKLEEALEAWGDRAGGKKDVAEQMLMQEVYKQVVEAVNSVGPGRMMAWKFSNVDTAGVAITGQATVLSVERADERIWVRCDGDLVKNTPPFSPVRIEKSHGRIISIKGSDMLVQFYGGLAQLNPLSLEGRQVTMHVDPTIQVTYKARATGEIPDNMLAGQWVVRNPQTGAIHLENRNDVLNRPATLTVSGQTVSDDGRVEVMFANGSPGSVKIAREDISILYPAGSFGWNYVRATALMLLMLVFLSALSVCAGSFVSFPVACMICFTMLPYSMARSFLTDAVRASVRVDGDVMAILGDLIVKTMSVLLPDFAVSLPGETLVDGLRISWLFLGQTAAVTIAMRTLLVLAVGCLLLRRRELARVQV